MGRPSRVSDVRVPGPLAPFADVYKVRLKEQRLYAVDDRERAAPGGAPEPLARRTRHGHGGFDKPRSEAVLRFPSGRGGAKRVLVAEPSAPARSAEGGRRCGG